MLNSLIPTSPLSLPPRWLLAGGELGLGGIPPSRLYSLLETRLYSRKSREDTLDIIAHLQVVEPALNNSLASNQQKYRS